MQNRDPQLETSGKVIGFYEREFYVFSNFSSFKINWQEKLWTTSEHAYQASKFVRTSPALAQSIFDAKSAHEAYKLAKDHVNYLPKNWDKIKSDIMIDICRHKLEQHPYVRHKLLQTGNLLLVEDSPKDSFWGWGSDKKGKNELGKIWMKLRKEIK
jgi:ribA/ribD-fused uncharacterized protein